LAAAAELGFRPAGVEFDGVVDRSSAMPPSATATPNTASSSAVRVLRLRF
jgi:hypothetical protein